MKYHLNSHYYRFYSEESVPLLFALVCLLQSAPCGSQVQTTFLHLHFSAVKCVGGRIPIKEILLIELAT
jgi:hypothetical protein